MIVEDDQGNQVVTRNEKTVVRPEAPPSCWGCGLDYLNRWKPEDLGDADYIDIKTKATGLICPDCLQELIDAQE